MGSTTLRRGMADGGTMVRMVMMAGALVVAACAEDPTTGTNPMDPTPPECGSETCTGFQYCEVFVAGVPTDSGAASTQYACRDAPVDCTDAPSCGCLSNVKACSVDCVDDAPGVVCTLAAP